MNEDVEEMIQHILDAPVDNKNDYYRRVLTIFKENVERKIKSKIEQALDEVKNNMYKNEKKTELSRTPRRGNAYTKYRMGKKYKI